MAKILLVEDDKSLREIYGVRLMAEGYTIVSAGDGEEALAMAIKERPDLIISDVMMPKISGFDMLDILRSTTETKDVKVIMMTALSSDDQRARGEALGADRYLVKSQVGIEDVVRTVHDVLQDSPTAAQPATNVFAAPAPTAAPVAEPIVAPVTPAPTEPVAPAPVAPSQPPVTAPMPQPVQSPAAPVLQPTPTPPVAPITMPQPVMAPVTSPVPPAPVAPPVQPIQPIQPIVAPTPQPVPPVAMPQPAAPVAVTPAPTPAASPLPQPTAPFSSPRPASLGDRVINPISPVDSLQPTNMADLMSQELNGGIGVPPTPPVPPAA